ncbi:MAG: ankyrin repeat domain-containing protein [Gammaproteobacteria bacterium]
MTKSRDELVNKLFDAVSSSAPKASELKSILFQFSEMNIDINVKKMGFTPLMAATLRWGLGHPLDIKIITALLEAKSDPNSILTKDGKKTITPLLIAVERGSLSIVKELIDAKANLNQADHSGTTPLMLSINKLGLKDAQRREIFKTLLDAKADPNQADSVGYPSLMWAVRRAEPEMQEIVKELINSGAILEYREPQGVSAFDVAYNTSKQIAMISLLLSLGSYIKFPKLFFEFLLSCDQRDPGVLTSLKYLCAQMSLRLETKGAKDSSGEQIDAAFVNKAKNHLEKLQKLTDLLRGKVLDEIDGGIKKAKGKQISIDVLHLITEYDAPLADPRLNDFKAEEIDSQLQSNTPDEDNEAFDLPKIAILRRR